MRIVTDEELVFSFLSLCLIFSFALLLSSCRVWIVNEKKRKEKKKNEEKKKPDGEIAILFDNLFLPIYSSYCRSYIVIEKI